MTWLMTQFAQAIYLIYCILVCLGHTNLIVCLKAAARVSLNMRINIAKLSKFEFFF